MAVAGDVAVAGDRDLAGGVTVAGGATVAVEATGGAGDMAGPGAFDGVAVDGAATAADAWGAAGLVAFVATAAGTAAGPGDVALPADAVGAAGSAAGAAAAGAAARLGRRRLAARRRLRRRRRADAAGGVGGVDLGRLRGLRFLAARLLALRDVSEPLCGDDSRRQKPDRHRQTQHHSSPHTHLRGDGIVRIPVPGGQVLRSQRPGRAAPKPRSGKGLPRFQSLRSPPARSPRGAPHAPPIVFRGACG